MLAATVERRELNNALKIFATIISKRSTVPILTCLAFRVEGGRLTITGTDSDIFASAEFIAKDSEPGFGFVDCHAMAKAVGKAKGGMIRLVSDGAGITLSTEGGPSFRIPVPTYRDRGTGRDHPFGPDDYPTMPDGLAQLKDGATFQAAQLREDLERIGSYSSTERTRLYLNGIFVHELETGELAIAATDGHRMAQQRRPMPVGLGLSEGSIVPNLCVSTTLATIKAFKPDTIRVSFGGSGVLIAAGPVTLRSKLIDGMFPDYQRCKPSDCTDSLTVDAGSMADAVKSVAAIGKRGQPVKLSMGDGWATLLAKDGAQNAAIAVSAPCTDSSGPFAIGFNSAYAAALLKGIAGNVRLDFNGAASPFLVTAPELRDFWAVCMPIRLPDATPLSPADVRTMNGETVAPLPNAHAEPPIADERQADPEPTPIADERQADPEPTPIADERQADPEPTPIADEPCEVANPAAQDHDPIAAIEARLAAIEDALERLVGRENTSSQVVNHRTPETVVKRTAAHERAIRRAWLERGKARQAAAMAQARRKWLTQETERNATLSAALEAMRSKRARAISTAQRHHVARMASQGQVRAAEREEMRQRKARGKLAAMARGLITTARQERDTARQEVARGVVAQAALQARADRAETSVESMAVRLDSIAARLNVA